MRHVRAALMCSMLVAAHAVAATAAPADPQQKAVCRGGDARAAIRACSQILDDRQVGADDRLLAYVNRGNAYDATGDRGRARKDYDAALAIAPKSPWVYRNRGAMFMGGGQLDEAARDFDAAIGLDPSYGYAWASRCNVRRLQADRAPEAARRGLYEQALLDCEQAFAAGRLDEFMAGTYEVRGLVHQALGHVDAAVADFTELIRLRPDSGRARVTLADTLRLAAQSAAKPAEQAALLQRARTEYQHAVTLGHLGPAEVVTLYNRGLVSYQLLQTAAAIEDFTRALTLAERDHPLLPYIYAGRAMALADAGALDQARKDVDTASTLAKHTTNAHVLDSAREYVSQRGL